MPSEELVFLGPCSQWCQLLGWQCALQPFSSSTRCSFVYMPLKKRSNTMHLLCGALHVSFVLVRVTRDALLVHSYSYVPT